MSFMEKHRFAISPTQQALLKMAWEGEIFGTAMCEAMAEKFPEYTKELTAGATMEWYNVHYCEEFGHDLGVHVSLAEAEAIGQAGTRFFQSHTFETAARVTMAETPAADVLYAQLGHGAGGTPELKALGEDLVEHENALRDFLKSVLDGKPDGGAKIFAYLERKGITERRSRDAAKSERRLGRRDTVAGPRIFRQRGRRRQGSGGDQELGQGDRTHEVRRRRRARQGLERFNQAAQASGSGPEKEAWGSASSWA